MVSELGIFLRDGLCSIIIHRRKYLRDILCKSDKNNRCKIRDGKKVRYGFRFALQTNPFRELFWDRTLSVLWENTRTRFGFTAIPPLISRLSVCVREWLPTIVAVYNKPLRDVPHNVFLNEFSDHKTTINKYKTTFKTTRIVVVDLLCSKHTFFVRSPCAIQKPFITSRPRRKCFYAHKHKLKDNCTRRTSYEIQFIYIYSVFRFKRNSK